MHYLPLVTYSAKCTWHMGERVGLMADLVQDFPASTNIPKIRTSSCSWTIFRPPSSGQSAMLAASSRPIPSHLLRLLPHPLSRDAPHLSQHLSHNPKYDLPFRLFPWVLLPSRSNPRIDPGTDHSQHHLSRMTPTTQMSCPICALRPFLAFATWAARSTTSGSMPSALASSPPKTSMLLRTGGPRRPVPL
jgi:hypothetical protein